MPLTINEVKRKYESGIMEIKGVVSVGIGLGFDNKPAIVVGLERESRETANLIPSELEGYPVEIRITGVIRAQ